MPSIASTVSLGFGPWGAISDTVMIGFGSGAPPVVPIGSIRVAAVESRPGIRIRDMVVPTITLQGFDATPDGINVGNVEVIP